MDKFYLLDIIATDYDLLKKSFCGKTDKQVINANSETIEDVFHNRILYLIENPEIIECYDFDSILTTLRTIGIRQTRQIVTVEYNDNHSNIIDSDPTEYDNKLKLLLIHYAPNKQAS